MARTAERAKFDFIFLAEGLRLREQNGGDLRPRRRRPPPDNATILAAVAAVTDRLGLAATISSTFNEPTRSRAASPPSTTCRAGARRGTS